MAYMSRAPENNSAAAGHGYHGPDLISGLPDELLHHVLTFVPTLDSICTSVLSRRWIDVWTRVPQLILRDEILDIELMTDILSRYAADVYITDLKICYHWDYPQLYEAQVTSWAEFAAQRVTGRVDLSVTTQFETAWPNEFVDLPCFGWATEISIYSSGMAVRLPPPAAVTGGGDEFTRLTRLQMSHLRLSDDGEGISDVVSRRCPRLEILELDHIGDGVYDDVISLSLHSESLQSLRIVSVCCLRRLEVDAANMHEMRVEYCFAESNGPTAMRLSAPAMEVLGWEDKCPNEVELITLPMFLKELFYSEIPDPRSYRVAEILEHFARVGVLRLVSALPVAVGLQEQQSLIHRVQLPYCSELDLSVITKQHMSYGSCIIHFLKRNSTIRSLALTLHAYHPETNYFRRCMPDCTCHEQSKWWDQEMIPLDSLEELAIDNISGKYEERQLICYIMRNSKMLKKITIVFWGGFRSYRRFMHSLCKLSTSRCTIELNIKFRGKFSYSRIEKIIVTKV